MKPQRAALGFRVKSGWAAAVLVSGTASSPRLCDVNRIDLSDPRLPETRQPYHATLGQLQTDTSEVNRRVRLVRSIARKSIVGLLEKHRQNGFSIGRAALVVGSQTDPDLIANPHVRAHAFEGQLFRSVLEEALQGHGVHTEIVIEHDAYARAAMELKRPNDRVRDVIQKFGQATEGSWRAEQKLAALAAWLALR